MAEPSYLVRVTGQAPIQARIYELGRLRCNLCSEVYAAKAPEGVGEEKYDASAASMIGLLRYGTGLPFYRLAGLQHSLGIPLPKSTQWDIVAECAPKLIPAYSELILQAAQGELLHNVAAERRHDHDDSRSARLSSAAQCWNVNSLEFNTAQ